MLAMSDVLEFLAVDDGLEVDLFGGDQGKALGERVARLGAEERIGAGAGAVRLEFAVIEDVSNQVEVGFHPRGERRRVG